MSRKEEKTKRNKNRTRIGDSRGHPRHTNIVFRLYFLRGPWFSVFCLLFFCICTIGERKKRRRRGRRRFYVVTRNSAHFLNMTSIYYLRAHKALMRAHREKKEGHILPHTRIHANKRKKKERTFTPRIRIYVLWSVRDK